MNKSESKAKAEADLVEARENKEAVMLELEQLANYKAELHQSCDFIVGWRGHFMGNGCSDTCVSTKCFPMYLFSARFPGHLQRKIVDEHICGVTQGQPWLSQGTMKFV